MPVNQESPRCRQLPMMNTVISGQLCHLAIIDINAVYLTVQGVILVGFEDDALLFGVETKNILNNPWPTG